jgi:F420-dependent oxidoreductase-like protein
MEGIRFGLDIAQQRLDWSEIVRRAQLAEQLGFDGVWGFDHFEPMYGTGPGNCFEGWTTLAALSGVTERVRLGLLVTGNTYRHPSLLAAEAIVVDHASGGRVEFSLGAAWHQHEHDMLGFEFPPLGERISRFEEAVQIIRALFTQEDVTFDGRYYKLEHATLLPHPVQQPGPPIWIGASGERRMLPIVARYADVWHCFGSLDELKRKSALLDNLAVEAEREPSLITRSTNVSLSRPIDDVARDIDALHAAGFTYLIAGWPSEGQGHVEAFAKRFLG